MPRIPLLLLAAVGVLATARAEDFGQLVFSDDFNRQESQEKTDEPGNGWETNSRSRAKGNKQVDLVDGAMRIYIHAEADHAVSVTHPFAFTDGAVKMRFKLEDERDRLGLNFADLEYKEVHAGHLCMAIFSPKDVTLRDLKTGVMELKGYEARKAGKKATPEEQAALKTKEKVLPCPIKVGDWHELVVRIEGTKLSASVDGKDVGEFSSPGIGHPTKRMLRLNVPRNAVVDDIALYCKK